MALAGGISGAQAQRIDIQVFLQDNASGKVRFLTNAIDDMSDVKRKDAANTARMEQAQNKTNSAFQRFINVLKVGQDAIVGFNGALLSLLFLGMQMQRTFTNALKAIFEGYKEAIPEGHKFNAITNELAANWEFFKFQIADALANSPMFERMTEIAVWMLDILSTMPEPLQRILGYTTAILAAFGTLLFFVGVTGLGLAGLVDSVKTFKSTLGGISFAAFAAFAAKIIILIAAFALLNGTLGKFWDETKQGEDQLDSMKSSGTDIINNFLAPFRNLLEDTIPEMENFGEVGVFVGAIVGNALIFLLVLLAGLSGGFRAAWEAAATIVSGSVALILWKINLLLHALVWVAKAMDYVFGTDVASSVREWQEDVSDLSDSFKEFAFDLDRFKEVGIDTAEILEDLGESFVSPSEAVEDYRKRMSEDIEFPTTDFDLDQFENTVSPSVMAVDYRRRMFEGIESPTADVDLADFLPTESNTSQQPQQAGDTTNIIIGGLNDALEMGLITEDQAESVKMAAGKGVFG